MNDYHDEEWGIPEHDDVRLFESLTLEGAQAGLSWSTILNKRDSYREAFYDFDPRIVARFDETKYETLLTNAKIIRNRQKVKSAIENARGCLEIQYEFGSFDKYIWSFVNGDPIINSWSSTDQIPTLTSESKSMSKGLQNRGFKFVGPTICYAFMQAKGLVMDHILDCFRYKELAKRSSLSNPA